VFTVIAHSSSALLWHLMAAAQAPSRVNVTLPARQSAGRNCQGQKTGVETNLVGRGPALANQAPQIRKIAISEQTHMGNWTMPAVFPSTSDQGRAPRTWGDPRVWCASLPPQPTLYSGTYRGTGACKQTVDQRAQTQHVVNQNSRQVVSIIFGG
jgi:hypothetical protein